MLSTLSSKRWISSKAVEYQAGTKLRVISARLPPWFFFSGDGGLLFQFILSKIVGSYLWVFTVCNFCFVIVFVSQECSGSICLRFQLLECQCQQEENLCDLCCKNGEDGECKPIKEMGVTNITNAHQQVPGAPCNNFNGYCDVFLKCRAVVDYSVSNLFSFF